MHRNRDTVIRMAKERKSAREIRLTERASEREIER